MTCSHYATDSNELPKLASLCLELGRCVLGYLLGEQALFEP